MGTILQVSASNACDLGPCLYLDAPAHQRGILVTLGMEEANHQRRRGVRVDTVVATASC